MQEESMQQYYEIVVSSKPLTEKMNRLRMSLECQPINTQIVILYNLIQIRESKNIDTFLLLDELIKEKERQKEQMVTARLQQPKSQKMETQETVLSCMTRLELLLIQRKTEEARRLADEIMSHHTRDMQGDVLEKFKKLLVQIQEQKPDDSARKDPQVNQAKQFLGKLKILLAGSSLGEARKVANMIQNMGLEDEKDITEFISLASDLDSKEAKVAEKTDMVAVLRKKFDLSERQKLFIWEKYQALNQEYKKIFEEFRQLSDEKVAFQSVPLEIQQLREFIARFFAKLFLENPKMLPCVDIIRLHLEAYKKQGDNVSESAKSLFDDSSISNVYSIILQHLDECIRFCEAAFQSEEK